MIDGASASGGHFDRHCKERLVAALHATGPKQNLNLDKAKRATSTECLKMKMDALPEDGISAIPGSSMLATDDEKLLFTEE